MRLEMENEDRMCTCYLGGVTGSPGIKMLWVLLGNECPGDSSGGNWPDVIVTVNGCFLIVQHQPLFPGQFPHPVTLGH